MMEHCDMLKCNPICVRCGDTPACGDGSWGWMDGVHRHRCRDSHPQCGHDRVPCEKHQPQELIELLRWEVQALRTTRDVKEAEVERLTKDRDAQAEAVRVLGRGLFNRCFLGYDREWAAAEIARIPNAIARAAVKGGEG